MDYIVKKSKIAKNIRISIQKDATVILTLPKGVSGALGDDFIKNKKDWIEKKVREIQNKIELDNDPYGYHQNKKRAYKQIKEKVEEVNIDYGFAYKKISIKNQKSRWGSCSSQRNLNFNYKIIFLPARLFEYIITHELCHLRKMNHSPEFWSLVSVRMPDYKDLRQKLKEFK